MLYREAGQFKTSYVEDAQIFPIRQDRIAMFALLAVAFVAVPLLANQYWLSAILTPFLIFALATIGLNILTGYAGQLSLGTAAFMAVGAFAAYNFMLRVPGHADPGGLRARGCLRGAGRHRVRPAQPAHQGLLPRGGHAGGAVLRRVGADPLSRGSRTTARRA